MSSSVRRKLLAYAFVYSIIATVIILIILTLAAVIMRRLYMERKYRRLDQARKRYSTLSISLEKRKLLAYLGPYRRRPGSAAWVAVEESIFRAFETAHCRDEAARLFDKLGYADYYMKTIKSGNRWEQALAAERLGRIRCARAQPVLVEALESRNTDLLLMAIHALGLIEDGSVLPKLIKMLKSAVLTGEEVSKKVLASSIISFGAEAVRALAAELADPDWRVRAACLNLLGEIGGANLAPLFMKMLNDPEQDVRAKAAKSLGRLRCVEAAPRLESALADRHWVVRLHSARALGFMKEERSVPALTGKLTDRNWQVRRAAAEALGAIGGAAYLELLKVFIDSTDQYAREQALDELGRSGVAAILLSMLPQGEYNYLLLKEIPPADDKGGIRMELLVDMLLFLSALDGESMSQALAALQGVAGGGSAKSVINAQNRIKEFGSRGKGIAE